MEQSITLASNERKRAAEKLARFVADSVENARAINSPFFHIEFGRVFPEDVYRDILRLMPVTRDYRPMHGRSWS